MTPILRALMVEDNEDDMLLIQETLRSGGYDVRARRVETEDALRRALRDEHWDIVLSDYCLPSFDAQGTLRVLGETGLDLPVIVISGTVGEDVAVETLKLGAEDYLLKQNLTRLVPAVARALDVAEGRRQHRKLEQMKTIILEKSPDIICTVDSRGHFLEVSTAAKAILGYEPAELVGIPFEKLVHPDDLSRVMGEFQSIIEGRRMREIECRLIHKSGQVVHITWATSLSKADDVIVGIGRDITARKQKEEALRRVEENVRRERALLRALIDSIPDLVFFKDKNFVFLGCNRAFENYLGVPESQIIGTTDFSIMPEEEWARYYRAQDENLFATGQPQRTEENIPGSGGSIGIFDTIKTPFYGPNGELLGLLGVSRDITARKQMEEDLRGERDFSNAVINGLPGIFYHFDDEGRFLRWNKNFELVTGYSTDELAAMRALDFFPADEKEQVAGAIAEAYEKGRSQVEAHFLFKDGRRVPYLFSGEHFERNGRNGFIGVALDISWRKSTEQRLRQERDYAAAVLNSLPGVFYHYDENMRLMRWNKNLPQITGYSDEELAGADPFIFFVEEEKALVTRRIAEVFEKGESSVEADYLLKDGRRIPYLFTGVRFEHDGRRHLVGIGTDITERKRAEAALQESLARFHAASRATQNIVWDWDLVTDAIWFNEHFQTILGYGAGEIGPTSESWSSRIHPEDSARVLKSIRHVIDGADERWSAEYRIRRRDGSYADAFDCGYVLRDASGRAVRMVGVIQDITERKRMEEALRQETAMFVAQVESSPDGILVVDRHGRNVIQNQRMSELWKLPPEIAACRDNAPHREFAAGLTKNPAEFSARVDWFLAHPEAIGRDEIELIAGTILDRYSAPVLDKEGRYYGRTWIHRDITEERRREQKLAEALIQEKELSEQARAGDRAKSEFLAVMSHEVRTPLNGILGFAELLRQTPDLPPESRDHARVITESGEALLRILDDILDFSRLEAGRVTIDRAAFRPRALLEDIRTLLSQQAANTGVQLLVSCAGDVPERLEGDDGRLRQVLLNLAGNALKFTEQGSVRIDLAPLAGRPATYVFTVADTGCGIVPEQLDRIFQPFIQVDSSTSRRHSGTGLGLAISRRLIELLGGAITVRSTPGQGSEFRVTVPLEEAKADLPAETSDSSDTPLDARFARRHPLRLLIAEDDPVNLKLIKTLLHRLGYEPLASHNGREAVEIFEKESPDFILMDMQMPEMDGVEATAKIRALEKAANAKSPAFIVALTANIFPADRQRCLDAGMNDYLNKPVKIRLLAEVFAQASLTRAAGAR